MADRAELGRDAFSQQRWADAVAHLEAAVELDASDTELLAVAAHMVGHDDQCAAAWERAHAGHARAGEAERAARCAFWLALLLLLRGEMARASGWMARAERLVGDDGGAVRAFLRLPSFFEALESEDHTGASAHADEMVAVAEATGDRDLMALGLLCQGEALIVRGEVGRGTRLFDEAMVSVTTGEVSPILAGIVFCGVIEACIDASDIRRAAEWTEALRGWCASQPDLVPYRGQCLVHRSQVLQAYGSWGDAVEEVERARLRLSDPEHPALGSALYQRGELHRLRGERKAAEQAYRAAHAHGRSPAPGLALLRLSEGRVDAAAVAIRGMVEEGRGGLTLPTILAAAVEVLLAAGDLDGAGNAARELVERAGDDAPPMLVALARHARGSVLRATGDPAAGLSDLRHAITTFRELGLPYDAARCGVEIALACRALGDEDAARLEVDTAREAFGRLGAEPDLARLDALIGPRRRGGLTDRECEVLRLVAAGNTDREIAATLVISEHTVGRHLQNIFTKLDLSSRAAATAYAYEHGVV